MTKKKATEPKYNANAAPELLYQLSKASQSALPASGYLKLATKCGDLTLAIKAYAPGAVSSPRKFADSLRLLVGVPIDHCGERLTLKSRYVNRKHQTEFAVAGSLRDRIMKARDVANRREAGIKETAHVLAVELRKHGDPVEAIKAVLPTIAPESTPERCRREAVEATRKAGYYTPFPAVSKPVERAPVIEEPETVPPPPVVDTTARRPGESMPDYILRTGNRSSYHTPTRVEPWTLSANVPRGSRPSSGPEVFDFSLSDVEREARKPKKWSPC